MIGSFKNNHRRNRYKSNNERNFRKRNGNGHKVNVDFNSQTDFKRKNPEGITKMQQNLLKNIMILLGGFVEW